MWRILFFVSFLAAVALAVWPAPTRQASAATPAGQGNCCLIQVMHYGGNLICHDRFENNVMGSGNNSMGRCRVEAMSAQCCVPAK
jgi:hypothetical protein